VLGIEAEVYALRAETLSALFDCVILRAVDKMPEAVTAAAQLVGPAGWLALMTTGAESTLLRGVAGAEFSWSETVSLPFANDRILALGRRAGSAI
jgi:16S rRNA G527 N7-methylase RsmG